ncbi:hypothetical protein PMI01_04912 [Caulobacter sp. AP07]|uniref:hypothetical protein n=1 Tax=Caulobacter sp. AP07 TaxID=1144304 RepID=UPI000271F81B|nr:hypothetical protein [Caulobacter sp. AP07]EJL23009.1 hypothetical protein PMI01_04912 [Caulobacter sp. AP07]
MTDMATGSRAFEIGRVINRTFGAIGRNFVVFLLLAVILGGLPNLLFTWAQLKVTGVTPSFAPQTLVLWFGGFLLVLLGGLILQAAIVHATIADLKGRRASVGETLGAGLRHCGPLLLLGILTWLGLMIGFLLLIVPGIILAVVWSVTIPVKVAENTGVLQAFSRSRDLTRGRRWPIFGLVLIYAVLMWIIQMVIMGVGVAVAGALHGPFATPGEGAVGFIGLIQTSTLITSPVSVTLMAMISAGGLAALYYELRASREGVGAEALAAVFE